MTMTSAEEPRAWMGVGCVYPSAAQALSSGRDRCRSPKLPALKLVPSGVDVKNPLASPRRSYISVHQTIRTRRISNCLNDTSNFA